ncbi:helix-turn-helix domain-containing protein [Achromobacter deleyi]|uniref:helix-turn-helix domain-containing protein n=1 Tax=Achromobacter deleyi TaxID=1353891 RepID=UPI001465BB77|nr:helix-turn-helix transcriptional regulator [Achromobacter deleyi]CAB3926027.1 hypothetical protein LMG3412_05798 [Achromobacter deleyi]
MSTSIPTPSNLTPKHVRAARALLAWSQQDLAKAARVATSTVADFERGQRTPVANNAQAIRRALEDAGICFLATGAVIGPPVPRIEPMTARSATPVRWVSAGDLSGWADRIDGAYSLPTLVAHLIVATHGSGVRLRFPSDEGVRHAGWDGLTSIDCASTYVPEGVAAWEIGCQRSNITQKATQDYKKRTSERTSLDPANTSFVFVTPRHWPQKEAWIKDRQAEGHWRQVFAYDADDLIHWIEKTPGVGLWLASRLGKRPPGLREVDEVWEEWSLATEWPLTEELVLSDRDQDAIEVLRWLRGAAAVLSLRATTSDEVVAFFHSTLGMLPQDAADAYRVRSLVATTADSARQLTHAPGSLILLLTQPEPGLARLLAERGHYVLQAYDERPVSHGNVRTLARPSRDGIACALIAANVPEPRALALARDSARNLAVLRRLLPAAPGRRPCWAQEKPPLALLTALLVGSWDESFKADRDCLAEIAGQSYESIISTLASYQDYLDSPLQKAGSIWRIASQWDAWLQLARFLTSPDVARFEVVAHAALSSVDPRFEMDPKNRWIAAVQGIRQDYSVALRHGVGQTLILLALQGSQASIVFDASSRADAIVRTLLANADERRWWSLSGNFRLLAEASPAEFLGAIEDSLDQEQPTIRVLFEIDGAGIFETEHLSDLLWALESLAWSPDFVTRVSHILARLDAIDTVPGRHANRPANSLREIHVLWNPQTYADLDKRLRTLDLLRKRESEAAWKLMLGVLPRGHDSSTPSPMPRWRDFTVDATEVVTRGLIDRGAIAISDRLLQDAGLNATRWSQLLDRFSDLASDPFSGIAALAEVERLMESVPGREEIWTALRKVLHHHRAFPDAEWAMPGDVLDQLDAIYIRFSPTDKIARSAWLFGSEAVLPKPSAEGWQMEERDLDVARKEAAKALMDEGGATTILTLARHAEISRYVGTALYDTDLSEDDLGTLLETALRSEDAREREVAHGLIVAAFPERKEPWAAALIVKAKNWSETALLAVFHALPFRRWTWDQVAQVGSKIEEAYWRATPILWIDDGGGDVATVIRKLVGIERARHAMSLVRREVATSLPSELLVAMLDAEINQRGVRDADTSNQGMFQHYVVQILQTLDERDDVDQSTISRLEWAYLPLLEHSRRPAKALLKTLSEQPALFVEVLSAAYEPSEETEVFEVVQERTERRIAVASQAYKLLKLWGHIPGTRDDGTVDGEILETWIREALSLARKVGREAVADSQIGNMLSAAPVGADGNWPAEPVRDVLDLFRRKQMIESFWIGKSNRRGMTSRMPRAGGRLEHQEAAKYRKWSKAIEPEAPYTAKALDLLAKSYENEARIHDEEADRMDWGY